MSILTLLIFRAKLIANLCNYYFLIYKIALYYSSTKALLKFWIQNDFISLLPKLIRFKGDSRWKKAKIVQLNWLYISGISIGWLGVKGSSGVYLNKGGEWGQLLSTYYLNSVNLPNCQKRLAISI